MDNEILIDGKKVIELMPHRPPMRMIGKLIHFEAQVVRTALIISSENVFCINGKLSEIGLAENMAQSASIVVGYDRYEEVKANGGVYVPPFGYIGAINRLKIHQLPEIKTELTTEIKVDFKVGDITFVSAKVTSQNVLFAEGEMKVFIEKV
ncbi:MAG: hypothetical protein COA57_07970 [Flavobacteriales bacterium]|nr:hypothetical protein [Bacteroidales bacterium AH-315-I05]PCJ85268.1 MAG: hypothetical protein COA57_07970 [Flavobacteriales bacterium]